LFVATFDNPPSWLVVKSSTMKSRARRTFSPNLIWREPSELL
jgi:hypothetical protein